MEKDLALKAATFHDNPPNPFKGTINKVAPIVKTAFVRFYCVHGWFIIERKIREDFSLMNFQGLRRADRDIIALLHCKLIVFQPMITEVFKRLAPLGF